MRITSDRRKNAGGISTSGGFGVEGQRMKKEKEKKKRVLGDWKEKKKPSKLNRIGRAGNLIQTKTRQRKEEQEAESVSATWGFVSQH